LPSYTYHDVFPPEHVFKYADLMRKQLGTDYIDLLQFHVWTDEWTDEPDFRKTLEKLKRDGIIRHFGLSLNRWEPENGIKAIRTGLVDAVQVIYSIFDQSPEDELFPACQELNIGVIVRVFVLSHPAVGTTIVGMRRSQHVRENTALSDMGPSRRICCGS